MSVNAKASRLESLSLFRSLVSGNGTVHFDWHQFESLGYSHSWVLWGSIKFYYKLKRATPIQGNWGCISPLSQDLFSPRVIIYVYSKALAARPLRKKPRVTIHDIINQLPHNFMHSLANPFVRSISIAHSTIPYLLRLPRGIRLWR